MDIEPDRKSGRRTTATVIGIRATKLLIIFILSLEIALLVFVFKEIVFASMLSLGLVWLLIDLFVIYKLKTYSVAEMKLFGVLSNVMAIFTMAYVWYSGCLL